MTDLEALSRLLDGDLSDPEAEALRARIAADPELAHHWESLRTLSHDLDGLTEPMPEFLVDRVLGPAPARRARWLPTLAVIAAAVFIWLGLGPTAPAEIRLLEGSHRIEGTATALAGTVRVDVDGIALISVQPVGGLEREWSAEEDPMSKTAVMAALGGALVTVAVYEGRATVFGDGDERTRVVAGEQFSVGGASSVGAAEPPPTVGPPDPMASTETLRRENAALREALETATFEGAVARGQLVAHQGEPIPWSPEIPSAHRPEAYEDALQAVLENFPEARLETLDCDEFPCIALLASAGEGWEDSLAEVPRELATAQFPGEPVKMQVLAGKASDDPDVEGALAFVLVPQGEGLPDAGQRADYRTKQILDGFLQE